MKRILLFFAILFLASTDAACQENEIAIYPNPCAEQVTVKSEGWQTLEVYDTKGDLVLRENLTSKTCTVNLSSLENGMYVFVFKALSCRHKEVASASGTIIPGDIHIIVLII